MKIYPILFLIACFVGVMRTSGDLSAAPAVSTPMGDGYGCLSTWDLMFKFREGYPVFEIGIIP